MKKITVSDESMFDPNLSIKCYGFTDPSPKNIHVAGFRNAYILNYIVSGEGIFASRHIKGGKGFLIEPAKHFDYISDAHDPWHCFWVTFSGAEAEKICKKYIKANSNGIFKFNFTEKLYTLIDTMFSQAHFISQASALSYFFQLLSFHEENLNEAQNPYIAKAKNYIKANFQKNLSVKEIAQVLSINDRYLYNLFIKYEKISPKQYINKLKIHHAKSLLKNTTCSISEIADSSGFTDQLAFSHFFKKETGFSPSDYRRKKLTKNIKN